MPSYFKIKRLREHMKRQGFFPVTQSDLVSGKQLVQIETSKCQIGLHNTNVPEIGTAGATVIQLCQNPVRKNPWYSGNVVFFSYVQPASTVTGQIPIEEFLEDEYVPRDKRAHLPIRYFVAR